LFVGLASCDWFQLSSLKKIILRIHYWACFINLFVTNLMVCFWSCITWEV